jgi:cyclin-dependent kinase regulatory subunit CKS1
MPVKEIYYSDSYTDEMYEYRHVILPLEQAQIVSRTHLLTETEWRNLGMKMFFGGFRNFLFDIGLQMSAGWIHYMLHNPGWLEYLLIRIQY